MVIYIKNTLKGENCLSVETQYLASACHRIASVCRRIVSVTKELRLFAEELCVFTIPGVCLL